MAPPCCSQASKKGAQRDGDCVTLAITTRSFNLGLDATASPNFLYSGVRCLQWPHLPQQKGLDESFLCTLSAHASFTAEQQHVVSLKGQA